MATAEASGGLFGPQHGWVAVGLTFAGASEHCPRPAGLGPAEARDGAVAQLGERLVRNEEARGSNPLSSTTVPHKFLIFLMKLTKIGKPSAWVCHLSSHRTVVRAMCSGGTASVYRWTSDNVRWPVGLLPGCGLPSATRPAAALRNPWGDFDMPAARAHAVTGAAQRLRLQFHQPLRCEANHLAQQRHVGTFLQQSAKGDHFADHRGGLSGLAAPDSRRSLRWATYPQPTPLLGTRPPPPVAR